jgi:L-aspartate oxidase
MAVAARAGAVIADAEFVQFHPTAINMNRDPAPLATEALRGDGATLVNASGQRFMLPLHKDAELAPRDIVARGVFREVVEGRGAFLDTRAAIGAAFPEKFPTVYASCKSAGIDPITDLIPVIPAEHYHMGGITGVHGANRLASNSLLEAVVFAARIAEDIAALKLSPVTLPTVIQRDTLMEDDPALKMELRNIMSQHVGVMRDGDGITKALDVITRIQQQAQSVSLQNMAIAAQLVATAALVRHESRGGHFRTDFPGTETSLAWRSRYTLDQSHQIATEALST